MSDTKSIVRKRKAVPSVLVDCEDCDEPFEITLRTFDLAFKIDPDPTFRCDDCKLDTGDDRPGGNA